MKRSLRPTALAVSALLLATSHPRTATAQDLFGSAVAVSGGEVLVVKPTVGRGLATVHVFRWTSDGGWLPHGRLSVPGSGETGEALSPSLAAAGATVVVGSGDPDVRLGAHEFHRSTDGGWSYRGGLPATAASPVAGAVPATVDLGTVMRILSPPLRLAALRDDGAVVSVVGPAPGASEGVRILRRTDMPGGWRIEATLAAPGAGRSGFGSSIASGEDRVWVGAPGFGVSGAVFGFEASPGGDGWVLRDTIALADLPAGARLGAALAVTGPELVVGAPGPEGGVGSVVVFRREGATGRWLERARLRAGAPVPGDRFGSAVAAGAGELWVGAPGADGSRGSVHRFVTGADGWVEGPRPILEGLERGFALGSALAVDDDIAVVGAPLAHGGTGRVVVFRRSAADWGKGQWLAPGHELEIIAGEEVRCRDGDAAGFDCRDVDLLAYLPIRALGGGPAERVSDVWGWTDPATGREYALVGRTGGAAVVDVTDPTTPRYLGVVTGNPSGARDLKIYRDHLFFTGDGAGNHGLVVFDLARLRTTPDTAVVFEPDARYEGIASAHNLVIDTGSGFACPVGASGGGETCGGGLHMVDVRDPLNPTFAGCYTDTEGLLWPGRTHDAQCVVYRGPDGDYQGREICFASNETALRIVDVTDKSSPTPVGVATYPGLSYVHQGWLTEDQRYFYLDDELDELVGQTERTRTLVWDVAELDDPILVGQVEGPDRATDHNLFVKGNRMYQANYQAGFRILDISDPENPVEIGHFDTTPYEGNPPGFFGAWTAFPFFESGTVLVSSMYEGLFLLRPSRRELIP